MQDQVTKLRRDQTRGPVRRTADVYDILFGDSRIRVERRPDGSLQVVVSSSKRVANEIGSWLVSWLQRWRPCRNAAVLLSPPPDIYLDLASGCWTCWHVASLRQSNTLVGRV